MTGGICTECSSISSIAQYGGADHFGSWPRYTPSYKSLVCYYQPSSLVG